MKPLLVICGLLVFVIGCATTPPQDSIQSKSIAVTPSQPSQSIEAVTATSTAPKMIEVAVKTEPTIQAQGSRLSQPTISVTPAAPTPSLDPKPFSLVLHDHTPSRTQAAHARQHEAIVIVLQSVSPRINQTPRFVDVAITSRTQSAHARQHEEIVIVPRQVSSQTWHEPRHVDVATFLEESSDAHRATETFIITPAPR